MSTKRHNPTDRLRDEAKQVDDLDARREKLRQAQLFEDRQKLLKQPEFIRVMSDLLARGLCFHSVMTGNSFTYHNAGRQDFARMIFADLMEANEDIAIKLMSPKSQFRGIKLNEGKDSYVG